jgi:hypothetical protein
MRGTEGTESTDEKGIMKVIIEEDVQNAWTEADLQLDSCYSSDTGW